LLNELTSKYLFASWGYLFGWKMFYFIIPLLQCCMRSRSVNNYILLGSLTYYVAITSYSHVMIEVASSYYHIVQLHCLLVASVSLRIFMHFLNSIHKTQFFRNNVTSYHVYLKLQKACVDISIDNIYLQTYTSRGIYYLWY